MHKFTIKKKIGQHNTKDLQRISNEVHYVSNYPKGIFLNEANK